MSSSDESLSENSDDSLLNDSGDSLSIIKDLKFNNIQIAFCIDATESMEEYIEEAKETIIEITEAFKKLKMITYEFAFVAYRDHCDEDKTFLVKHHDFDTQENICKFIDSIGAEGGGDGPEAVMVGLNTCAEELSWKGKNKAIKIVYHVADAPPHGKEYCPDYKDDHPDGCPKGYKIGNIAKKFKEKEIQYILMDCADKKENPLNEMKYIFAKNNNFGYFDQFGLDKGIQMLEVVGTSICDAFENDKEIDKRITQLFKK